MAAKEFKPPAKASASRGLVFALLLTALVYTPALYSYFHEDDWGHLMRTADGQNPWGFGTWFYRPLFLVVFGAMHRLYGLNAPLWHASTIALHLANVAMVYWLARRLKINPAAAAAGAALFGVWPTHPDAVSWLCACSGLLSALLGLTAAHIAISTRIPSIPRGLLCAGVWMLALLAKEDAAGLVLVIPFLPMLTQVKTDRREALKWFGGCLAFVAALLVFRALEMNCQQSYGNPTGEISLGVIRRAGMFTIFALRNPIPVSMSATIWSVALTALAPIIAWRLCPALRPGILWFFGAAMGIGAVIGCLAPADRYYYIPSIGIALFFAALADSLQRLKGPMRFNKWVLVASGVFMLTGRPDGHWGWMGPLVAGALILWFWIDSAPTSRSARSGLWMVALAIALRAMYTLLMRFGWAYVPDQVLFLAPFAIAGAFAVRPNGRFHWAELLLCGCAACWLESTGYTLLLTGMLVVEVLRSELVTSIRLPGGAVEALKSAQPHRLVAFTALVVLTCAAWTFSQNLIWMRRGVRLESTLTAGARLMKTLPRGAALQVIDGAGVGHPEPSVHRVTSALIAGRPDLHLDVHVAVSESLNAAIPRRSPRIEYSPDKKPRLR